MERTMQATNLQSMEGARQATNLRAMETTRQGTGLQALLTMERGEQLPTEVLVYLEMAEDWCILQEYECLIWPHHMRKFAAY